MLFLLHPFMCNSPCFILLLFGLRERQKPLLVLLWDANKGLRFLAVLVVRRGFFLFLVEQDFIHREVQNKL